MVAISQFLRSLQYPWYEVLFELAMIWVFVYLVFRFLRGTRGAGVVKGFALLLVVLTLTIRLFGHSTDTLGRLNFLYDRFLGLLAIVLVVVFQPELRQAMIRLGHARLFRGSRGRYRQVVGEVAQAVEFLSKNQFGAVIAIERNIKLGGLIEGGVTVDAKVSSRLLSSIFWPNAPLHDLGVVIRDDRIVAANVQFPLIEGGSMASRFGSRHRAAAGLTMESDCIVVIVSEETGAIGLAERGRIETDIVRENFREILAERLESPPEDDTPDGETDEAAPDGDPAAAARSGSGDDRSDGEGGGDGAPAGAEPRARDGERPAAPSPEVTRPRPRRTREGSKPR